MHKEATINTRIEPKLKHDAELILHKIGMSSAEAVRLFYTQICLYKGLPFDVRIPNTVTRQAMQDIKLGKVHSAKNVRELFKDLD